MTETLAILRRLRRLAADQARRGLAMALTDERLAAQNRIDTEAALRREAQAAPADAAHPLAGSYAAWLPAGMAAASAADSACMAAASCVAERREALAQARASERAVAHVQQARQTEARIKAQRKNDNA